MELLDKRIQVICRELRKLSVKQKLAVELWEYKEGNFVHPADAVSDSGEWNKFDARTMRWYGPDKHYWFRTEYEVPQELAGKRIWLRVCTQAEGWDANNPQFLLFVDDVVTQGMDVNHQEAFLGADYKAGQKIKLGLQAYTGTVMSEFQFIAEMREVDAEIESLYYDIKVPLSAFSRMEKGDKIRLDLEKVLNDTINLLDLRTPYSAEFYESLRQAQAHITKALYEDMAGYEDVIATCIGHTHIDVAWLWTVAQTREKTARSFATVLKLMEEYPGYKFMSSQPQLYVFLKERYPELYERIRERIEEKRWEPEGGMWVEADCNLTSGESLVRQFMHGKRFFKEEFGLDNKILWLPDVFGYSGALPQIMKKSGIDYFMTTKLAWNQFNKVPYDTLRWRGIDGTEVLTHLVTTLGVGQSTNDYFTTYNGMLHPDAIMGGWTRYQNKDINNDILVSYGFGDGGGGPTRDMLETSVRMEKGLKGIPKVRQEFSRTYFDELKERVMDSDRLPVWEGEFYFEYHRGTYTSMSRNKRSNRKAELKLMDLELLSVLADAAYPSEALDSMWKTVLINQFHDILPGSAIKEVYEVTKEEYGSLMKQAEQLVSERLQKLAGEGGGITVFNTTGHDRNDIVVLGACTAAGLTDESGTLYPVQQTEEGAVAFVQNIPSKGYKTFAENHTAKEPANPFALVSDFCLETPYYTVSLNENGMFTGIYDKEYDRQVLKDGAQGNLFRMFEDKPVNYDNWDMDVFYSEKYWDAEQVSRMEWLETGPVRAALLLERKISNSVIRQKIYFYAGSRRIDFETYLDWKEHQHLLKVQFPVAVHTDEATFDIQFGNLTRKVHTNTSWDMARFESCGQKWMDLSEGHYGVSLLNDCKYGHSVKDGCISLTLVKSGIDPNPVADQEEHYFTYALYPHGETWRGAGTVAAAYDLNQPMYALQGGTAGTAHSLAKAGHGNVIIETIKAAEDGDGVIVRMYESENAQTKTELIWGRELHSACECNLLEEPEKELEISGNRIAIDIKPYEIKTVRIR